MTLQDIHLVLYGQPYTFGLAGPGTPRANPTPGKAPDFLARAQQLGLGGVEFGPPDFPELADERGGEALAEQIRERGLRVVLAMGYPDPDTVRSVLEYAHRLGASTIRCVGSSILCGERTRATPDWATYREQLRQDLRQCGPLLEEAQVALALENHQDLSAEELVDLCHTTSPARIGVTLDTGNPLAVAADVLDFAARVKPYLRNLHLKDYRVQMTPAGYRLVRCALGEGVVDFPGLWALLADAPQQPSWGLELAALHARLIRTATADFWR